MLVSLACSAADRMHRLPLELQLTKLANYSDHANPAVTRILFTPNDMLARQYVAWLSGLTMHGSVGLPCVEQALRSAIGKSTSSALQLPQASIAW